jgi:hypothetical protein
MSLRNVILGALVVSMAAFAQKPANVDAPFQVKYAANLNAGESYIDIANDGAQGSSLYGSGFGAATGNICVSVYAFDAAEEMASCCSCLVTPDQTVHLGANADLVSNTVTAVKPTSMTIKLLASIPSAGVSPTSCANEAASNAAIPVTGMAAWGTTLHSSPPTGTVVYAITVNTSSIAGAGFVEMQFNPGGVVQPATAQVESFNPDGGTIVGAAAFTGAVGGQLPGTVTFQSTTANVYNDYYQQFTFGNQLSFQLVLSGPAITAPLGLGESSFFLTFWDSTGTVPLLTTISGFPLPAVAEVDVLGNGSTAVNYSVPVPGGGPITNTAVVTATPLPPFASTETPFTPATLSAGELASLTTRCATIVSTLSGAGICASCRNGAM